MNILTQNYPIALELHNFCRTFDRDLTKPRMGRIKELLHGIIRGQRGILSDVARQNRGKEDRSIRRQVQQYSNMLLLFPLQTMITRKLVGFRSHIQSDTPLYYDLVDISKEYHKGMECIGKTWNGSEGKPGEGYEIMDVSMKYEGGCTTLIRHTYSTAEEEFKSQAKELEKVLNMMMNAWGEIKGTLFFDAGADNDRIIRTLIDFEAAFAIRMNVNRGTKDRIFLDEENEEVKMMDLWKKEAMGMTVWEDKKRKKKKMVQLQWRKVFKKIKGEIIPLSLVWCHREGDPNPVVFLTSRMTESESDAAKVYRQYFDRGKEEAVFKCHKNKLGMEDVQLESFEKIKQFMLLYVLADQLLYKFHCLALEDGHTIHMLITAFIKGEQRQITKWAVIDWYNDEWSNAERQILYFLCRYPPPEANIQASLFSNLIQKW